MKKVLLLFLVPLILFGLVACGQVPPSPHGHESVLYVYVRSADAPSAAYDLLLDWEDAKTLISIFQHPKKTVNSAADCAYDYLFNIEGQELVYHRFCGTFQDLKKVVSYEMSEAQTAAINEIVDRTIGQ